MVPERRSTTVLGARLITVADHGFVVRSGMIHGGYDWVAIPGWLTWEWAGVDLGVGQPVNRDYAGPGAYGGFANALYFRPCDNPARRKEFSIFHRVLEIVLTPRVGWWSTPEDHRPTGIDFEYAADLGIRLVLGSDFASREQGIPNRDREPVDDHVPATGRPGAPQ